MATIVVGIDTSDHAKAALRWALEEAQLRQATVVAIHAWEPPVVAPGLEPAPQLNIAAVLAELRDAADRLARRIVEEVAGQEPPVTVEPTAVEGPAATALVEAAEDADLLVVGSRGLGGFRGLLLGSVSQQCVQHAPCPVLVHRRRRT
jgi:nucleotide-binding universal stress UspA family protein